MNENSHPHQAQPVRVRKYGGVNTKVLLVLIIMVITVATFYFKPEERVDAPAAATSTLDGQLGSATEESQNILASLSEIYEVPVDDEPVMYTIDDAAALIAQQAFFTGSQNGDTLFIFPKSMKAVIYSQQRNKVINAGPLSYQGDESAATPATEASAPTAEITE